MKKIAIISGGDSSEYEVSLRSARAICDSLIGLQFDPRIVILRSGSWTLDSGEVIDRNDFSYLDSSGVKHTFDYALITIHGTPGENGLLQGYLELIGMPYSGCSTEVSAITFNKSLTKKIVSQIPHIGIARQVIVRRSDAPDTSDLVAFLGLPMFVKPNASGSSCGVTKVKNIENIDSAIQHAFSESNTVLIEEFIEGTEISQGIMVVDGREYILPITELVSHNEFFDYQAKYTQGMTDEITPARLPDQLTSKISAITSEVYRLLGCRGVVRVDYIVKEGTPYFIEVNTNPGMSQASIVPQQWNHIGLSMGQAWAMIINDDLSKKNRLTTKSINNE